MTTDSKISPVKKWAANEFARVKRDRKATQTDLGKALGISQPQAASLLNGDRLIGADEIPALERFFGVPYIQNPEDFTLNVDSPITIDQYAPVKGEVAAGVWLDHIIVDEDKYPPMPAHPDPKYKGMEQFALRVRGDSMDRVVKDGDFVFCINFADTGLETPDNGKIVVVERTRAGLTEYSLKRVMRNGTGNYELWPESNNQLFQTPIDMAHQDEGTEVKVTALVIGSYSQL